MNTIDTWDVVERKMLELRILTNANWKKQEYELAVLGEKMLRSLEIAKAQAQSARAIMERLPEVVIEELAAIIDMEAQNGEWQSGLDIRNGMGDVRVAFVPDGACFRPLAENIRQGNAPDEITFNGVAAVGDRVRLDEARANDIVVSGADRNLQFETMPRARASQAM